MNFRTFVDPCMEPCIIHGILKCAVICTDLPGFAYRMFGFGLGLYNKVVECISDVLSEMTPQQLGCCTALRDLDNAVTSWCFDRLTQLRFSVWQTSYITRCVWTFMHRTRLNRWKPQAPLATGNGGREQATPPLKPAKMPNQLQTYMLDIHWLHLHVYCIKTRPT